MNSEESEVLASKIASVVFKAQSIEQRLEILGKQLLNYPPADQAMVVQTMSARSTVDLSASRMILLMMDVESFGKALGAGKLDALRGAARSAPQFAKLDTFFTRCSTIPKGKVDLYRAKLAMMMQTASLLNDKLEAKKLPLLKADACDLAGQVISHSAGSEDSIVTIDLNMFSRMAWDVAKDILLEADFEGVDEETYQIRLTEEQVTNLSRMTAFSAMLSTGVAAKFSESMVQRQAIALMKRFCLVVRTATMYPPDHPGLPAAFESVRSSLENALADKEMLTLTVMGTDILLDDVKIRKEDKFKTDFCRMMDERQVASVTFRSGFTLDELKTYAYCFTEAPKQLQDKGGIGKILQRKDVHGIVVDQFTYGVLTGDGKPGQGGTTGGTGGGTGVVSGADDKLLENLIYSQVMDKVQKGSGVKELSIDEVGAFFKDILSEPTEDKRRALARMLLTLDPGLFERGFLSNPEMRKQLSWAAARKTLDVMLKDLEAEDVEGREHSLETIEQLMEIAITRNKENTIQSTIGSLIDHLIARESDADLALRTARVLKTTAIQFIRRNKLEKAHSVITLLLGLATDKGGRQVDPARRPMVLKASRWALREIGVEEDVVDMLVDSLASPDAVPSQMAGEILESLDTDMAVNKMFRLFLDPDRAVRAKAYRIMKKIGPRALRNVELQLEILSQKEYQGRDQTTGRLKDEDWFVYRNCVDLLAEIEGPDAAHLIIELMSDGDPRVRRECLIRLIRIGDPQTVRLLKNLSDPSPEVRDAAIMGFGVLAVTESVGSLIEVFYSRKQHREAVLTALERLGTEECLDFLLPAVALPGKDDKKKGRRFPDDPATMVRAIKTLGAIGGPRVVVALESYVQYWSSRFKRAFFRPVKELTAFNEIYESAIDSLAQARRRPAA